MRGATPETVPAKDLAWIAQSREERLTWFRDARFGMFIHWGPSTLSGSEISWGINIADRPEKGGEGLAHVPADVYHNLYKKFNPVKFDADRWCQLAKQAGMKYIVLTTKHHDGFCLWPTEQVRWDNVPGKPRHYSIADTPYGKDIVGQLYTAAKKHGLKVGWYYSTRDWSHPDYNKGDNKIYNSYYEAQVKELMTRYKPDLMWYDSAFGRADQYTQPHLFKMMYDLNPKLLVNDRAASGTSGIPGEYWGVLVGDYDTPENHLGSFQYGRAWESCMILSNHPDSGGWSYRADAKTRSLKETIRLLSSSVCGDGNMLLNLAPQPDGQFRPEEEAILRGIAPWTAKYGEAIYGTRGGPWTNGPWGGSTHRGNIVYVHVFDWHGDSVRLMPLAEKILRVETLTGGQARVDQTDKAVTIRLDKAHQDPIVTLVKLTLDRPVGTIQKGPAVINTVIAEADGTIVLPASAAQTFGDVKYQEINGVGDLGYWTNPQGGATWQVEVAAPGKYEVSVDSGAKAPGIVVAVECDKQKLTGAVANTGSHTVYQANRLAGSLTIAKAGVATVAVRAADPKNWQPVNIHKITLIPIRP